MHYVYLLKSIKRDFLYIGSTKDLRKRLLGHNKGENQATKFYAPFDLIYP
jgi:putative endonuclease